MKQDIEDILRAEEFGLDLQDGPFGIHVYAMQKDGELYELGYVSSDMVFQDPTGAMQLISKIKFERFLLVEYFKIQGQIYALTHPLGELDDRLDLKYYITRDNLSIRWIDEETGEYSAEVHSVIVHGDITYVNVYSDCSSVDVFTMVLRTKNRLSEDQTKEYDYELDLNDLENERDE